MTDTATDAAAPLEGTTPRILIIEARFYEDISDMLLAGAKAVIEDKDLAYEVVTTPGAMEIPAALRYALRSRDFNTSRQRYDGYVILGCVIRGETSHYDIVCRECTHGVMTASTEHALALGFGLLTVENRDQAVARASQTQGNQGGRAASACLHMIDIKRRFSLYPR